MNNMTTVPGRAEYKENEDFRPLRKPKFFTGLRAGADEFVPRNRSIVQQLSNSYLNEQVQQQQQQPEQQMANFAQTGLQYNDCNQHFKRAPPNDQYRNAYQPVSSSQQHQRLGRQQQPQHQQFQEQQQQQQQQHQAQMNLIGKSVQDRLRIGSNMGYPETQQYLEDNLHMNNYHPESGGFMSSNQYQNHSENNYDDSNNVRFNNFTKPNFQRGQQQHNPHQHQQHQHQHQQHQQNHHQHHHQQRYSQSHGASSSSSSHNGGGYQYGNSSNGNSSSNGGSNGSSSSGSNDVQKIALDYLQTVIQCLNQNPGQFDTVATHFITIFDGMENNTYVLSIAMEDIFKESIENTNFRYMGAKLYNLLHMLDMKKDSLFQTLLKYKLDYHKEEVREYMQKKQHTNVCNTALFLAELYMQLRIDDNRIRLIADNIVYSLKQLLQSESAENIRCVCLTLKLAGYDLTADCAEDMKEIIATLDKCNQNAPGKYPLAANVISLQKNNWGRRTDSWNSLSDASDAGSTACGGNNAIANRRATDEPIFYGPDGKELTAEESEFLQMSGNGDAMNDEDYMADLDVDYDPEMDEETEKDYVEFCKLNQSKQ